MNKVNVWIDVDGTLVDTNTQVTNYLNNKFNKSYTANDVWWYDFTKLYKQAKHNDIIQMFEDKDFYENITAFDYCCDVINQRRDSDMFKFNIVTCGTQENLLNKYNWIMNNIKGDIAIRGLLQPTKKGLDMAGAIQIDDEIISLRESNAAVKILFRNHKDREYNRPYRNEELYIVNDWREINDIFSFVEKEGGIECLM